MILSPSAKAPLQSLPLQSYPGNFSLDHLVFGVDNVRIDAYLSPQLEDTIKKAVTHLIARFTESENILDKDDSSGWIEATSHFKKKCREIMMAGLKKAKAQKEPQIDLLANIAIVKMIFQVIPVQYQSFGNRVKRMINQYENSHYPYQKAILELKEKLAYLKKNHHFIIENVSTELITNLTDIQRNNLYDMRRISLGKEAIPYEDLFSNPILVAADPSDYNFLLKEYIPLGNQLEDPLLYSDLTATIMEVIKDLLSEGIGAPFDKKAAGAAEKNTRISSDSESTDECIPLINGWMKHFENMDLLFNRYRSENQVKSMKKIAGISKRDIRTIKRQAKEQAYRLDKLYRRFRQDNGISKIVAYYEMQPVYEAYCPPLTPSQILKFLTAPGSRRNIYRQFKNSGEFYDRNISMAPLRSTISKISRTGKKQKQIYLTRFLKRFARYHKDYENNEKTKSLMDGIHLITEEKTLRLSRTNNTLYEFLLPNDRETRKKSIAHHTIIKADVRSSTEIVRQMEKKGLNPASFFSLNFFNPITKILPEFDAEKVFIEGDAIILSTEERETGTGKWLGVARACGLTMSMLHIVNRYNQTIKKHGLPILEVGIGIGYMRGQPTYLFDGEKKIMISPAINKADRMAGCSKMLARHPELVAAPFNLFVFQSVSDKEISKSDDDLYLRYNVNGIELNKSGFKKLSSEIELKRLAVELPGAQKEPIILHTGVYPTADGTYQRLVIREADIKRIAKNSILPIRNTGKKYFEICTSNKIYELARKHARKQL